MTELPQTKDVIAAMLKENTGTHFLDSGGYNGRAWQRNQLIDFEATAPSQVEFDLKRGDIVVTKDIYHYMVKNLAITEKSQELYEEFMKFAADHPHVKWYELYDMFPGYLNEIGYLRDDGKWEISRGYNSYNYESSISQVFQWRNLYQGNDGDGDSIIILEIHGGADVRGGYTDPKFFEMDNDSGYLQGDDTDYAIYIGKEYFYTDDGHHWYTDGCVSNSKGGDLLLEMLRNSVAQGLVPGVEPDEEDFTMKSDELGYLSIKYKHRSDNCRKLDEFIEV